MVKISAEIKMKVVTLKGEDNSMTDSQAAGNFKPPKIHFDTTGSFFFLRASNTEKPQKLDKER